MLAFRIIAAAVVVALVFVLGAVVWSLSVPGVVGLDATAARRITQICGFSAACKVKIDNLFEGDWDTFYAFGADVPQEEVDSALGPGRIRVGERQRLLVLTKGGRVVTSQHEDESVQRVREREVQFDDEGDRDRHWIGIRRGTVLRVNKYPIGQAGGRGGSYYVLSTGVQ
jgi:hypothetical protein